VRAPADFVARADRDQSGTGDARNSAYVERLGEPRSQAASARRSLPFRSAKARNMRCVGSVRLSSEGASIASRDAAAGADRSAATRCAPSPHPAQKRAHVLAGDARERLRCARPWKNPSRPARAIEGDSSDWPASTRHHARLIGRRDRRASRSAMSRLTKAIKRRPAFERRIPPKRGLTRLCDGSRAKPWISRIGSPKSLPSASEVDIGDSAPPSDKNSCK